MIKKKGRKKKKGIRERGEEIFGLTDGREIKVRGRTVLRDSVFWVKKERRDKVTGEKKEKEVIRYRGE